MSANKVLGACISIAITAAPAAALAQTADRPAEPVKASTAQADAAGTDGKLEEVVVTGIRRSLEAAVQAKREADSVVDVISSEDLGKFSDTSLTDALQRVSGVQIERNDSGIDGDRVSIRGLGSAYVMATLNGRVPMTYGSGGQLNLRQFNFEVLPTEVLTEVVVYKTPTAELVESGMAGSVDAKTLRPLDFKYKDGHEFFVVAGARGRLQPDLSGTFGSRYNLALGGKSHDGSFGAYVSVLHGDEKYRESESYVQSFGTHNLKLTSAGGTTVTQTLSNIVTADQIRFDEVRPHEKRDAVTGGIQWRPVDGLDINLDYTYSKYNTEDGRNQLQIDMTSLYGGLIQPGGVTVVNGQVKAVNASLIGPATPGGAQRAVKFFNFDFPFPSESKSQIGGLNAVWKRDSWTVSLDSSFSKVDYFNSLATAYPDQPTYTGPFTYDGTGTAPLFNLGTFNPNDPTPFRNAGLFGLYVQQAQTKGTAYAQKLDVKKELADGFDVKAGLRFSSSDIDARWIRFPGYFNLDSPYYITNTTNEANAYYFGGTYHVLPGINTGVNSFAAACFTCVVPTNPAVYTYIPSGPLFSGNFYTANDRAAAASSNPMILDPASSFLVGEKTGAFYLQFDGKSTIAGMPIDGNVGVRIVRTKDLATGFTSVAVINSSTNSIESTTSQIITTEHSYQKVLPSLNIHLLLRPDLALRFAYSEVMSRPELSYLPPRQNVYVYDKTAPGYDPNLYKNSASGSGNVNLKPTWARQLDFTGELYTANSGVVYGSAFYKRVYDFILPISTSGTIPGFGTDVFDQTNFENIPGGTIKGLEFGFYQPFKFLTGVWRDFGLQGSYTWVQSSFDNPGLHPELLYGFPGASKNNANAVFFYEKGPIGARIAATYRGDYFSQLGGQGGRHTNPEFSGATTDVSASVNYDVFRNFTVTLAGTNLLKSDRRDYSIDKGMFYAYFQRPRFLELSVRYAY